MLKGVMLGAHERVQAEDGFEEGEYAKPTYSTAVAGRWKRIGTDFPFWPVCVWRCNLGAMRALLFALIVVGLAACGGGDVSSGGATTEAPPKNVPPSGEVLLGQNILFGKQRYLCYVCHSIGDHRGNGRGPDLNQLPELAARANRGSVEEFIRDSILHPNAYTEPGFERGLMAEVPGIPRDITAAQLDALVAFLMANAKP